MTEGEILARLAKINARIDELLDHAAASQSIAGRSVTYRQLSELEALRDKYEAQLAAIRAGGVRPAKIRFQRAS